MAFLWFAEIQTLCQSAGQMVIIDAFNRLAILIPHFLWCVTWPAQVVTAGVGRIMAAPE